MKATKKKAVPFKILKAVSFEEAKRFLPSASPYQLDALIEAAVKELKLRKRDIDSLLKGRL